MPVASEILAGLTLDELRILPPDFIAWLAALAAAEKFYGVAPEDMPSASCSICGGKAAGDRCG